MSQSDSSISNSDGVAARRFLSKLFLFVLPFFLYPLFIYVVDPFNFLNRHSPISDEAKLRTAAKLNMFIWKMNMFTKNPVANILLGDSTVMSLNTKKIREVSGEDYFNFAYGGGTFQEALSTFWFANHFVKLRKVYIGINLQHYNDADRLDRTETFTSIQQQPATYFFDRSVLQSAVYATYTDLTHVDPEIGVPRVNRETVWQETLSGIGKVYRDYFSYPTKYRQELMKVVQYCKEHEVEVVFLILPSHVEMQRLLNDFKLVEARDQIVRDLATIAPVYDFDYENEITINKDNFKDPIHFNDQVGELIVNEIWGGKLQYGRRYP